MLEYKVNLVDDYNLLMVSLKVHFYIRLARSTEMTFSLHPPPPHPPPLPPAACADKTQTVRKQQQQLSHMKLSLLFLCPQQLV